MDDRGSGEWGFDNHAVIEHQHGDGPDSREQCNITLDDQQRGMHAQYG